MKKSHQSKSTSILLRFKQGNQFDTEASTKIKVPKGKFSNSLQRINPTDEVVYDKLNAKLRDLKLFISTLIPAIICTFIVSTTAEAQNEEPIPRFIITTVAGTGERGPVGDGGPAIEAFIQRPTAVAISNQGYLYIANEQDHRVRMVDPEGIISTVMGTGNSAVQSQDRLAVETNLVNAYGIATDKDDNLYVLSRGHSKIFKVGNDGIARRIVGTGQEGFEGDGGPAIDAKISFSNHLVVDPRGNLFIADTGNNRIRRVSPDGLITTIAGTGEMGFGGDGGPAVEARFAYPVAIAIDGQGNLYIADFNNHRIRKISTDGIITSVAGTGESGYNGDGRPALECQIGEPCGVAVDRSGYIYIGDQLNNRVRVVTPSGMMYTVAGTGVRGHTGDGGAAEKAQMSNPDIIALDNEGNLYIPDHINAVVRKLTRVTD
jgi:sugar lactone lactonase YvrE